MLIINLFGAPGAGKSTGAAYVFSQLKAAGVNAELVTEFAKDKVWEGTKAVFENQAYIFGKQYFRISRLEGKVDVVITDSPILLSAFYNDNDHVLGEEFDKLVFKVFDYYNRIDVFVHRVKPYNEAGRFQTEEESDAVSKEMFINTASSGMPLCLISNIRSATLLNMRMSVLPTVSMSTTLAWVSRLGILRCWILLSLDWTTWLKSVVFTLSPSIP